ncbi:pyridoxamine 5'-phosphate oxidase family protein [uncultured Jannaschia sp.]|uniref:pyridoxamine 5'-phosphate oxidase family protein n=1 Tax=uncultured Jannaschia sp. TaxID=293347 RepID=UPI00261FBCCA|nr:pyridoxamine 5'-phosphate oxidase family protein [uncultured Jannaschia sp.]
MSDPFRDLGALEAHVWDRLARGAAEAGDPFHVATLATSGAAGPEARMVGFRRADRAGGEVEVQSDLRTAKVRALERDSRAALLFWDPETQVQIRLSVAMRMIASDPARWRDMPEAARLNYGTDPAPGTPVGAPEDVTRTPDPARHVALVGRVRRIEALSLAHEPHRRAVYEGGVGLWVAP